MIGFAIITARRKTITPATLQYFACEAYGHVPGKCDRALFEQYYDYWGLSCATFLLAGFIPLVNLTFIINFQKIQDTLLSCCT